MKKEKINSNKIIPRKILIFDTTLRDGEQCPGASMSVEDKFRVATQLAKLKVDTIEAGFPISSPVQFDAVKLIAQKIKGPIITGLSRAVRKDIDSCYNSVKYSNKPGIHTFLATSDIHLKYKLKITRDRALEIIEDAVRYARKKLDYVQFSAEDATRTDWDFLAKVVRLAIKSGASVINLPDTVGYAIPAEYKTMIQYLMSKVSEMNDVIISVHCHNDLGLASANSLAALEAGASQMEGAINGIGERAGNAALEEIVMGLNTRRFYFNAYCNVKTNELYNASKLVSSITGLRVQPNKAIIGENAFSHEAGIHQDGVIKYKRTYEIMDPSDIGISSNQLILGRHSGKHGFQKRIEELGISLTQKEFDDGFEKFLVLADKKKQVYDDDLLVLLGEVKNLNMSGDNYQLTYFHVMSGTNMIPDATVKLMHGKTEYTESAYGDGPVDAVYKAIEKVTKMSVKLIDYKINSVTSGKEAQGEVTVIIEYKKDRFSAHGSSTDIVEASAKAFISAINRILLTEKLGKMSKKKK